MRLLVDNPIFMRDLNLRFREMRFMVTLTLTLLLLLLILLVSWPNRNTSLYFIAKAGKELFGALAFTMMTLLMIVTASFSATSLSSEKEAKTIETLFISITSDWEIVLGKLHAANFHAFLILVASFPVVLSLFALGGIGAGDVFGCFLYIQLVCYTFSAMATFWSAVFLRSSRNAIGMTVFASIIWLGLPLLIPVFLHILFPYSSYREMEELAKYVLITNPYFVMASFFTSSDRIFDAFLIPPWLMGTLVFAALSLLFLVLAKEVIYRKRSNYRP